MSSTIERLQKIINAYHATQVKFKVAPQIAATEGNSLVLDCITAKAWSRETYPEDGPLQEAFEHSAFIHEMWNSENASFYFAITPDSLFRQVKNSIFREYDKYSTRCKATKRKTEAFIHNVDLNNKHIGNFLLQLFVKITADNYGSMSRFEIEAMLEPLEALRRTYGKR